MSGQIGELLDGLGVTYTPDDGEFTIGAVVLLKTLDTDGDVSLRICGSEGVTWIDRVGLYRAAETMELAFLRQCE